MPWYILCVKYLGLKDSIWGHDPAGDCLGMEYPAGERLYGRHSFEMTEAAKIDGAGDFFYFYEADMAPLSKPVVATIGLFYGADLLEMTGIIQCCLSIMIISTVFSTSCIS